MYKLVAFDAYGTLFDVYSMSQLAEELFPGHGQNLSLMWRDRQIEYTRLITASDPDPTGSRHYLPFWDVTVRSLRYCCKRLHLTLDADTLLLSPFPAQAGAQHAMDAAAAAAWSASHERYSCACIFAAPDPGGAGPCRLAARESRSRRAEGDMAPESPLSPSAKGGSPSGEKDGPPLMCALSPPCCCCCLLMRSIRSSTCSHAAVKPLMMAGVVSDMDPDPALAALAPVVLLWAPCALSCTAAAHRTCARPGSE